MAKATSVDPATASVWPSVSDDKDGRKQDDDDAEHADEDQR